MPLPLGEKIDLSSLIFEFQNVLSSCYKVTRPLLETDLKAECPSNLFSDCEVQNVVVFDYALRKEIFFDTSFTQNALIWHPFPFMMNMPKLVLKSFSKTENRPDHTCT